MAKQLQLRRGTTTQHGSFTGLVGEVTVDTTKDTAVVHDGSTAGGKPLATEAFANAVAHTGDVTGSQALTIEQDAVDLSMLSATGTADATTFLRGDNSWQTAGSTSATDLDSGTLATARMADKTIIQVVSERDSEDDNDMHDDWDTSIYLLTPACAITLSSAYNKVLVLVSLPIANPNYDKLYLDLRRNSSSTTLTGNLSGEVKGISYMNMDFNERHIPFHFSYLDTPGYAEEITYWVSYKGDLDYLPKVIGSQSATTTITAMEIKYSS